MLIKKYYDFNSLSNLFDEFIYETSPKTNNPNYDIIENDKEYIVELGLVGFKKEDIAVEIKKDILSISAERKELSNIKYSKKGSFYGKYKKSIYLPDSINVDIIEASFKDGLLQIKIPKLESITLHKKIEIT